MKAEEAWAYLQAHGHHKEDQSELLDDMQHLRIKGNATSAQGDAHKEHPGDAQRYFGDLDLAL